MPGTVRPLSRSRVRSRAHEALFFEPRQNLVDGFFDGFFARVDFDFGVGGSFVGVGDAGEVLDLAGTRLGVEALGVALFDHGQGSFHVDLDEGRVALGAALVAHGAVGADGSGDRADPVARQHVGHKTDAADVGVAVLFREAQTFGKVGAHDVAVEYFDGGAALDEDRSDVLSKGGFAGTGKAGEPKDKAVVSHGNRVC